MLKSLINPELTLDWLTTNASGKGVEVAVIDSGVDPHHPDLAGKISRSCNVNKNQDGEIVCNETPVAEATDDFGHGTAVSGIITKIAPDARIVNVRVLNEYNSCTGDILIAGIRWALDQDIKLINMSLATMKKQFFPDLMELCERAYEQNAIMVVSRRNVGGLGCPAMFSSVISVERGEIENSRQIGYKTGNFIECDAFGTQVKTAAPGGGYVEQTGTSFATPHIAGYVALMRELYPNLITAEAKTLLKAFSTRIESAPKELFSPRKGEGKTKALKMVIEKGHPKAEKVCQINIPKSALGHGLRGYKKVKPLDFANTYKDLSVHL